MTADTMKNPNWLIKLSQQKPMALPVAPPGTEREHNRGINRIDDIMTEDTALSLQQQYPEIGYGGAGVEGVVFKTGPGEMSKITSNRVEVQNARYSFLHNIDWVVPILEEPKQIQEDPPLWVIRMKELKPLKDNEQMLATYLTKYPDVPHIDWVMDQFVSYLDVDDIFNIYAQIKRIHNENKQTFRSRDLHGGNFGWDGKKIKVFDLGEGV